MLRCLLILAAIFAGGCGVVEVPAGVSGAALAFNMPVEGAGLDRTAWQGQTTHFSDRPLVEEIAGKVGHHAATIASFADGELLAAWYSYAGPHELDGSAIYTARRGAGAATWDAPRLHLDRPGGDGNPVLFAEGDAVWLFSAAVPFGWSTARIEVQQSTDRGLTWTQPVVIPGPLGSNVRCAPIRLNDGCLLLPAYDDLWLRPLFFAQQAGGNWTLLPVVWPPQPGSGAIQPTLVQLESGRLLCVMRNTGRGPLWVMASDDAGASWTAPSDGGFANPDSAAGIYRLAGNRLVLVLNDDPQSRNRLTIAMSMDDGRTWPFRRVISEGDDERSYPSLAQSPDGTLHIVYTEGRARIRHVELNEAWIAAEAGEPASE